MVVTYTLFEMTKETTFDLLRVECQIERAKEIKNRFKNVCFVADLPSIAHKNEVPKLKELKQFLAKWR